MAALVEALTEQTEKARGADIRREAAVERAIVAEARSQNLEERVQAAEEAASTAEEDLEDAGKEIIRLERALAGKPPLRETSLPEWVEELRHWMTPQVGLAILGAIVLAVVAGLVIHALLGGPLKP